MTTLLVGTLAAGGDAHAALAAALAEVPPAGPPGSRRGRPASTCAASRPFQRNLHLMVIVSFLGLALTGMILKFSYAPWAKVLARLLGGFETAGFIHRFCAVTTFTYFGLHILGPRPAEERASGRAGASSSSARTACCSTAATGGSSSAR